MSIMDSINGLLSKFTGGGKPGKPAIKVDKSVLLEKIRQTDLFKDLPHENLEQMFNNMETVTLNTDEKIITEGEEGDYYYLLVEGTARVTRKKDDGTPETLADLGEPTGFGEEALISNAKRNATITMTSPGAVMRLSKEGFDDYVKEPLVTWLSPGETQKKISEGAKWIDVRDTESATDHLHGALAIPMDELRNKFKELDKNTLYICYCENGRLSSTAAFLMRQAGFNVGVLRGGLKSLKQAGIA